MEPGLATASAVADGDRATLASIVDMLLLLEPNQRKAVLEPIAQFMTVELSKHAARIHGDGRCAGSPGSSCHEGQVSSMNFSGTESEASGTESAASQILHKSAGTKSGKHSLGSDVSTTATDVQSAPDPSVIPLPPGLHRRLGDIPPGGSPDPQGHSDVTSQTDPLKSCKIVDVAVAAYMAQLKSEAPSSVSEVVAPMVMAIDRLRDALGNVQRASSQFQFVWEQAQMLQRQSEYAQMVQHHSEYALSQLAQSVLIAQQARKASVNAHNASDPSPAMVAALDRQDVNTVNRHSAPDPLAAAAAVLDQTDVEALRRLLANIPGSAAAPPPVPQMPQSAQVPLFPAPTPPGFPHMGFGAALLQEMQKHGAESSFLAGVPFDHGANTVCQPEDQPQHASSPGKGGAPCGVGNANGKKGAKWGKGAAADGTAPMRVPIHLAQQAEERSAVKSAPAEQDTHETLRTHLQHLQTKDPARCFIVRKINRLGFDSPAILKKHFMQYGHVEVVLVAHSHVRCHGHSTGARLRPCGIGFVIMEQAEDAQRILALGSSQMVENEVIFLSPFKKRQVEVSKDSLQ